MLRFTIDNVDKFTLDVRQATIKVPHDALIYVIETLSISGLKKLALRMPVDTGKAVGGLTLTVGEMAPVKDDSAYRESTRINAFNRNIKKLDRLRKVKRLVVYLEDHVSYVAYLERGWSKQAPQGMFQVSFNELLLEAEFLARNLRLRDVR